MNISNSLPPNIKEIQAVFGHDDATAARAVYTYGDTLYNPAGTDLPAHLMVHEEAHADQQNHSEGGAKLWWAEYLTNPAYRLGQELDAYGKQYAYAMKAFTSKNAARLLFELARDLAGNYGLALSHGEAASKIRNRAKLMS